jgi:hypothetical protein
MVIVEVTHNNTFEISRFYSTPVKLFQNTISTRYRELTEKAVEDSKSWEVSCVVATRRLPGIEEEDTFRVANEKDSDR